MIKTSLENKQNLKKITTQNTKINQEISELHLQHDEPKQ